MLAGNSRTEAGFERSVGQLGSVFKMPFARKTRPGTSCPAPPRSAGRRCSVCNRSGYIQLYLRSRSRSTPDIQLPADLCGALAHAEQTVVADQSFLDDFRIHAPSVVPDTQPQRLVAIPDFRFDPARLRV